MDLVLNSLGRSVITSEIAIDGAASYPLAIISRWGDPSATTTKAMSSMGNDALTAGRGATTSRADNSSPKYSSSRAETSEAGPMSPPPELRVGFPKLNPKVL